MALSDQDFAMFRRAFEGIHEQLQRIGDSLEFITEHAMENLDDFENLADDGPHFAVRVKKL